MSSDLVAVWDVPVLHGVYTVEFEHGTLTGRRVIRVNGKVSLKFCIQFPVQSIWQFPQWYNYIK